MHYSKNNSVKNLLNCLTDTDLDKFRNKNLKTSCKIRNKEE